MTPHDRLYALTEEAIVTRWPEVRRDDSNFIVPTAAGTVTLCDGGIAHLDWVWLEWDGDSIRRLYRICRNAYISAQLPQPAPTQPQPEETPKPVKRTWGRRLWFWLRPRRALPRARLLRPGDL